jgi:hypothetical protein
MNGMPRFLRAKAAAYRAPALLSAQARDGRRSALAAPYGSAQAPGKKLKNTPASFTSISPFWRAISRRLV